MPRPPGRPADQLHGRMAGMLHALVTRPQLGCTKDELMSAAGLDPANSADERKYRRDLKALRAAGWQIDTIPRDAHDFAHRLRVVDARLQRTFTAEQREQLLRAAERAGLGQLYADLDPRRSDGTPGPGGPPELGLAEHAVRHRCVLTFTYSGKPRRVHPDDVFFSGDAWFMRGRDEADSAVEFKLFRLLNADDLDIEPPGTADPKRELPRPTRDPMLFQSADPITVEVATSEADLPDVIAVLGVNGHRVLPADPSTRGIHVEVTVTHADAFIGRLFELDNRVRLIGPEPMRQHARDVLTHAMRRH